jgi:hypothetical protein
VRDLRHPSTTTTPRGVSLALGTFRHSTFPGRDFFGGACRQRLSAAGKSIERLLLLLLLLLPARTFGMGHVRDDPESASAATCALPEAPPTCLLPSSSRGKCAPGGSGSDGAPALSVWGVKGAARSSR